MKGNVSPLFSQYIIDGQQMEQTPFNALYDCLDGEGSVDVPEEEFDSIVDEYMDKVPVCFEYDESRVKQYIDEIIHSPENPRKADLSYPVGWTRAAINAVLLEALFKEGHFILQDLLLIARWDWNNEPAGNLAAFYDSTVTAGHYLFDIGVRLDRYFVEQNRRDCLLELSVRSRLKSRRACPDTMSMIPGSWILYIPFDCCKYQLGGSALSAVAGNGCGTEMESSDPDVFMDCYEVVREFVEDGVITAGIPVGRGGLAVAAEKFRGRHGLKMDIGGIMTSVRENDPIKVLFAQMPGVLVQINDSDYDYVDSQLLLQEVAYFPVARPSQQAIGLEITHSNKDSVSSILDSLLGQASEGED